MASNYKRTTDNLDPERGDRLTTERTEIAAIFSPSVPRDIGDEIWCQFGRWFCGNKGEEAPHMENPLADAFLQTLISRQRERVSHYIESCKSKRRKNKGDDEDDGDPDGPKVETRRDKTRQGETRRDNTQYNIRKRIEKNYPEGIDNSFSIQRDKPSSVGSESQLQSAGACAGARPAAVESGHTQRTATVKGWTDHADETFDERGLRERPVEFVLELGIDDDERRARAFYTKALRELGPDVYAETCWRFVERYTAAANAYGTTRRELEANWDKHEAEYAAKGATWEDIVAKAENKNWNLIRTNREQYEKYSYGGRILAGMLKEAGLAHGIDLTAKRKTKKGSDE